MGLPQPTLADDSLKLHEQEIKAGLLYNFLKYTEWPTAEAASKIAVCIFGDDPMESYLKPMAGRTVNRHEISVRKINTAAAAGSCHLLFIAGGDKEGWPELQKALAGKNILTVSDAKGFSDSGGMIEFGRKDNRIHVLLNLNALTAAGIRVHDRLLKLVTVVHAENSRL